MGKGLGSSEILFQAMRVCFMNEADPQLFETNETVSFEPSRANGLRRLEQFVARTGRHYARTRNYDFGPKKRTNVSVLSPWLRHRLVTEEDILARVLKTNSPSASEKFVQEVFWRTYFKGWLEQRPSVWTHYQTELMRALESLDCHADLQCKYQEAVSGRTGIDCFDHWVNELLETGYLHNHSRMWFASIWIFTLRLPWQLGADFFLRHLLDGDPASNTLSWRWVAGLHTKGKTYLAKRANIIKYTEGRFDPKGLANYAEPLAESLDHKRIQITHQTSVMQEPYLLLLTEDDLGPTSWANPNLAGTIGLLATHGRSPEPVAPKVLEFASGAINSVLPDGEFSAQSVDDWFAPLLGAARQLKVNTIVTAYVPIGPSRSRLDRAESNLSAAGITLKRVSRPYDSVAWPHAKAGFFGLKKQLTGILRQLNLAP